MEHAPHSPENAPKNWMAKPGEILNNLKEKLIEKVAQRLFKEGENLSEDSED